MEKTNILEWMLFGIRLFTGIIFIFHGISKAFPSLGHSYISESMPPYGGFLYFMPFIETLGGGLIFTGTLIELGTLLVIPLMITSVLLVSIKATPLAQTNIKLLLNLMMLAVVIGICGPGKWAIWDPGKSFRKKFLKVED